MILIITHRHDYTADYLIDKLNKRSLEYFRFNCEDCLDNPVSIRFGNQNNYLINNISNFTAVWYRRTKLRNIKDASLEEKIYLSHEVDTYLHNLFEIIRAKWLSKPSFVAIAENMFIQLRYAKEIGFNIPNTLITTDKNELTEFIEKNVETVIKPIARGRINYADNTSRLIFTNIISKEMINEIDSYHLTPAIFQEYIEKEYEIRVTVVGNELFAARVDSQNQRETSIDWRKKKSRFEEYKLPDDLKEKCLLLLSKLDISFGAFDFIKTKDNRYYFLEVNPNGQWVWIENDTGLPISEAIINFLKC